MSVEAGPSRPTEGDLTIHKREVIRGQSRKIIYNVHNFLKKLSSLEYRESLDFSKTQELTLEACKVGSVRSIGRIISEGKKSVLQSNVPIFKSPGKRHDRPKSKTNLDDFEKDVLRRTIMQFYDDGQYPTAKKLTMAMREKINYQGSIASMYCILRNLGFRYRKCNDGRKFLMERGDIVAARLKFLRKMNNLRISKDERPRIYLDETWVNQNHSRNYIWQDSHGNGGLKVPVGKGSRLIVCHAGSEKIGFIQESKWIFRSGQKNQLSDYHSEINSHTFKLWFQHRLLNSLEEGSVIIMDNASYHSTLFEKLPNSSSRKQEVQNWLDAKRIEYGPTDTKSELLKLVEPYKSREKSYELDIIANEMGHEVIRLPPYHCQYNPIELVWARIKTEVADRNNTFKLADVERLMNDAIDRVTVDDWKNCVKHAERLQDEDFRKEIGRDEILERIVINIGDDSDNTDSELSDTQDLAEDDDDDDVNDPLAMPLS